MKQRAIGMAWIASLLMLLLAGCGETHSYRYKLTLEVDDNGRTLTGSNVVEKQMHLASGPIQLPSAGPIVQNTTHGEALVMEIQPGRLLIATLRARDWEGLGSKNPRLWFESSPYVVLQRAYDVGPSEKSRRSEDQFAASRETVKKIQEQRGAKEIPFTYLPDLVTFADPLDPKTVQLVDPDDLAATFGPGVRLVRATIEVTDENLTTGIEKHLPWVPGFKTMLSGSHYTTTPDVAANITTNSFQD